MVRYQDTLWCDGCGVEISWKPVTKDKLVYCCKVCLKGEKCNCEGPIEEYSKTLKDFKQTQVIND